MPTLYFMRHGETEANVTGILTGTIETRLTEKGRADAKAVGESLQMKFDRYYCSPLTRTHETLAAVRGNVPFVIDKRLIEVCSGDWQGQLKSELPKAEYDAYVRGELTPPNGESLEKVTARARDFVTEMFDGRFGRDEKILVVTHNAFMRQLKRLFLDPSEVKIPKNLEVFELTEDMMKKAGLLK